MGNRLDIFSVIKEAPLSIYAACRNHQDSSTQQDAGGYIKIRTSKWVIESIASLSEHDTKTILGRIAVRIGKPFLTVKDVNEDLAKHLPDVINILSTFLDGVDSDDLKEALESGRVRGLVLFPLMFLIAEFGNIRRYAAKNIIRRDTHDIRPFWGVGYPIKEDPLMLYNWLVAERLLSLYTRHGLCIESDLSFRETLLLQRDHPIHLKIIYEE